MHSLVLNWFFIILSLTYNFITNLMVMTLEPIEMIDGNCCFQLDSPPKDCAPDRLSAQHTTIFIFQ